MTGVETVRFWDADEDTVTFDVMIPGRGGLGGGIVSYLVDDFSRIVLCGLVGRFRRFGLGSPVRSGVSCPLMLVTLVSTSISLLLPATE